MKTGYHRMLERMGREAAERLRLDTIRLQREALAAAEKKRTADQSS
jgi:hypothetical protein